MSMGLEIAMNDAQLVGNGEGGKHLRSDVERTAFGERPVFLDDIEEVAPRQKLHRDVEQAVGLHAVIEHAQRVRVIEARGRQRFAMEPLREGRARCRVRIHHFDCDVFVERDVVRPIDRTHRAGADQRVDAELAGNCSSNQSFLGRIHGRSRRNGCAYATNETAWEPEESRRGFVRPAGPTPTLARRAAERPVTPSFCRVPSRDASTDLSREPSP
jgi:hypothetical protein